ncbi:MAG: outer membrane beta-barrel protein [Bacteroidota bacterium]
MKRILLLPILFAFFGSVSAQSLHEFNEEGFRVSTGLSIVDDSFSLSNNPFEITDNWNYGYFVSFEAHVYEGLSIEAMFSQNYYKQGNMVDGQELTEDIDYAAIDFNLRYNFIYLFNMPDHLEPYVLTGIGSTTIDDNARATLNYGFGFRFWFNTIVDPKNQFFTNLGVFVQTQGKSGLGTRQSGQDYGGQIQHTAGLSYRF